MRLAILAATLALAASCYRLPPSGDAPTVEPLRFLKGQTHAHSWRSLDSTTRPHAVMTWYAAHGYDFVVLTDHNRVTLTRSVGGTLAIPGVELTQNLQFCSDPDPEEGLYCVFHVNSLFTRREASKTSWEKNPPSIRRADLYGRALDRSAALGGISQLDHPNFHHACDAALIASLVPRGVALLEIANQSWDVENEGDDTHPSTEALWDAVLTTGARVWGVASDDAHDFWRADSMRRKGKKPFDGDHGFVMVRARKNAASIREAMLRGDFYSSTGVILETLDVSSSALSLTVASAAPVRIDFIGTGGALLRSESARSARFALDSAPPGYVRAVVTDDAGHKAWTQPVDVKSAIPARP